MAVLAVVVPGPVGAIQKKKRSRNAANAATVARRCEGRTKANGQRRCRRKTSHPSGRCAAHRPPEIMLSAAKQARRDDHPPPQEPEVMVEEEEKTRVMKTDHAAEENDDDDDRRSQAATESRQPQPPRPQQQQPQPQRHFENEGDDEQTPRRAAIPGALDIDIADQNDPFACTEYSNDIDRHLRHAEGRCMVSPQYMRGQPEINEKMRAILIDWLIEVHLKFKLRHETLFLTVNILDRFLEKQRVARNKLQLVGVTAVMIAAKYEEIYPPDVRDYVYICDNAYTRQQILQMEPLILNRLGFRFTVATPHTFLRRFCKAAAGHEGDEKLYHAASYPLELQLIKYGMLRHVPSLLVAAAVSIASAALGRPPWSPTLTKYARYTESEIAEVREELLALMREAPDATLQAVHKKYSSVKFHSVAATHVPELPAGGGGVE